MLFFLTHTNEHDLEKEYLTLDFFPSINLFARWILAKEKCHVWRFISSPKYILNKYVLKYKLRSVDWKANYGPGRIDPLLNGSSLDVYQNMWQPSKKLDKHVNHSLQISTAWSSSCAQLFIYFQNLTPKLHFFTQTLQFPLSKNAAVLIFCVLFLKAGFNQWPKLTRFGA